MRLRFLTFVTLSVTLAAFAAISLALNPPSSSIGSSGQAAVPTAGTLALKSDTSATNDHLTMAGDGSATANTTQTVMVRPIGESICFYAGAASAYAGVVTQYLSTAGTLVTLGGEIALGGLEIASPIGWGLAIGGVALWAFC